MKYATENKMTPEDLLELYGGENKTIRILWTEIDRYDYLNNTAPPYTLYTGLSKGLSLGDLFMVFLGLLALHFILLFIFKLFMEFCREDDFCGMLNIIISSFENMNICRPTQDWDQKKIDKDGNQVKSTIGYYKKRFREVQKELILSYILNWIFSFFLLIPFWYTGIYKLIN